jgi:signal transduction histidine kinase
VLQAIPRGRALALDAALGVLVVAVVSAAIRANLEPNAREPGVGAYAFSIGLGALMLIRRSHPVLTLFGTVALLFGYHALGYPAIGLAIPVAAAMYTVAEHGWLWLGVGAAVLMLAVSNGIRLFFEHENPGYLFGYDLLTSGGLMAGTLVLGDGVRSRRKWRAELELRMAEAERQREREAVRRVEQERLRIARDLHDVLTHTIAVISLHSDVAREALREDPDTAENSLRAVRAASSAAVRELRSTLELLRLSETNTSETNTSETNTSETHTQADRQPVGGIGQLDSVIRSATEAGLEVSVCTKGEPVPLPAAVDITVHRIVQEALTNVLRHARARRVTVELGYGRDELSVRITDDGRGAARLDGGWGIVGMGERAGLLGGSLHAGQAADGGFEVHALLPLGERG